MVKLWRILSGYVACMGEMMNAQKVLDVKLGRKRPTLRTRHRWEDNIKMGLKEIEYEHVD
jgi:hypothetical protein